MKKLLAKLRKIFASSKGFTLIELLVVIAIVGVLLAGTIVAINPVQKIQQAKDSNTKAAIDQVASAMQSYYTQYQTYPASGTQGIDYLKTQGEINSVPKDGAGSALLYKSTASCTGATGGGAGACTSAAVYSTLQFTDKTSTGCTTSPYCTVWCWSSANGKAGPVADATACTAP